MAIKVSNQITFTEYKKIVEIKEWYLATSQDSGVTKETEGWTEIVQTITKDKNYLWNYEEVIYSLGSSDVSDPIIIGVYGETGSVGASLQVKYKSSATVPVITNNNVSTWSDTVPTPKDGEKIYMTQKLSTDINWSNPIQISANDGESTTAEIIDGYWYINGEPTGVKAEGADGKPADVSIGEDGYWYIDGEKTNTKAQGETGKDGSDIEYVYYRSKSVADLDPPSYIDNELTSGWTQSPQGITETYKCEYVSIRTKPSDGDWGTFSNPVLWSKWGEKGQDGDGVAYQYYLSNSSDVPTYSQDDPKWTDDPTGVTKDNQYEYVVQIKTTENEVIVSTPSLWAKYGEDGKGISNIVNYYYVTQNTTLGDDWESLEWSDTVLQIDPVNRYLWNYEEITYTDDSKLKTDPAIIGAYGDSGTDAVDFQIYSVDGFEFKEGLTSIELKTVALQGGNVISSEVFYQWYWWNTGSTEDDKYEAIPDAISSNLIVNIDDLYAFSSLKCTMKYNDIVYEDYASLTRQTVIYTALAKFFNGSNTIQNDADYMIVYVELYKNNTIEESIYTDKVYISSENTVQDGIITTDITGTYSDDDMTYFVCKNTYNDVAEYDVILGRYASDQWNVVASEYVYNNDLFSHSTSHVMFIPKEKIARSLSINFEISNDNAIVARTNATVLDLNDPMISNTAPTDPKDGQLWLDTSVSPSVLKMWDGSKWVNSGYQNGNVVYTSKPINGYSKGDLWILADEETCGDFGPGSMLKADTTSGTFDESHWKDVDEDGTEQKNNIKQYFLFNQDTGLRIGQADDKFYVNISSTEMGFYDASDGTAQKVVSISNQSAKIKNLTVEDGALFNCEVQFGNFILKTENNGSLSLALK